MNICNSEKIIVKLVSRGNKETDILGFSKQTPNNTGELKNCKFIFDAFSEEYDWLAIIDDVPKSLPNKYEILKCDSSHTILITTEPSSITRYGKGFASQFEYLITNQDEKILPHKNALRSQTGNVWMYGKSYNEIINSLPIKKSKKISTICSNKAMGHTLHKKRFDFTAHLQKAIEITRCGWGYNPIDKKYEAIDDYEFHVCIENHIGKDVWTEKIADAFLGYCVPIYYGCPNIYDYFPKDSLILIDLNDFEGSIEKIKKIISTPGEYERRLEAVIEARRRVIEKYSLLEMINNIIENHNSKDNSQKHKKIFNRRLMRVFNPNDFISFAKWKILNFIKSKCKFL